MHISQVSSLPGQAECIREDIEDHFESERWDWHLAAAGWLLWTCWKFPPTYNHTVGYSTLDGWGKKWDETKPLWASTGDWNCTVWNRTLIHSQSTNISTTLQKRPKKSLDERWNIFKSPENKSSYLLLNPLYLLNWTSYFLFQLLLTTSSNKL